MCFHIIKYVYSFQRTHISVRHFVGVSVYAGTINRPLRLLTDCQNIADGLPKHCERIAISLLTDCDNILNKLQQHNIQKNKNPLLAMQKPPFCMPKTILLQRKNHTFTWRICNTQITNTLRTFRECILNALQQHC